MGTYTFNGGNFGAVGDNAVFIGDVSFKQVAEQLDKLRNALIENGKGDKITLNAVDEAMDAAKANDSDKLKERLMTLRQYVGSFIEKFSITFLSAILTKTMLG